MNQLPYLNVLKPTQTKSPTGKRKLFPDSDNKGKSVKDSVDNIKKVLSCEGVVEQSANYETIIDDQSDQTARRTLFSELENKNVKENIDVVSSLQEKVVEQSVNYVTISHDQSDQTARRTLFSELENENLKENIDVVSSLQEKVVEQSVNYETISDDQSDQTARRTLFSELENENVQENIDNVVSSLQERVAELLSANK